MNDSDKALIRIAHNHQAAINTGPFGCRECPMSFTAAIDTIVHEYINYGLWTAIKDAFILKVVLAQRVLNDHISETHRELWDYERWSNRNRYLLDLFDAIYAELPPGVAYDPTGRGGL